MPINATSANPSPSVSATQPSAGATATAKSDAARLPIHSISDILTLEQIEKHLSSLSPTQLSEVYAKNLPDSVSSNTSKEDILDVVRSGFFQQSSNKLSELLRDGSGAGYLLAQSLKYDYLGEGIDGFLHGVRDLGKKDKQEGNKDDDDAANDNEHKD